MKKNRNYLIWFVFLGMMVLSAANASRAVAGDCSKEIYLKDAVTVLQICAGMNPSGVISDVNKDGKIGMEEAVFMLRAIADTGNVVCFPDKNLEAAIRSEINRPTEIFWNRICKIWFL